MLAVADNITVCGLPLDYNFTSTEFLDLIKQDNIVGIISGALFDGREYQNYDYLTAKPGFDLLKESGFKFIHINNEPISDKRLIMLNCWYDENKNRRTGYEVAEEVRKICKSINKKYRIVYFCPGSPFVNDDVSTELIGNGARVIDTPSSIDICYQKFKSLGFELPLNKVSISDFALKENHVNIVCSLGSTYNDLFDIKNLINNIKDTNKCYAVKIGYQEQIAEIDVNKVKDMLSHEQFLFNSCLLVII